MAGKKSGLGRGLDALFPEKTVQSKPKTVKTVKEEKKVAVDTKKSSQQENSNGARMMKLSMIEPNREQPRKKFDEDPLYKVVPYKDMPETIQKLKDAGLKMAVCSNKPHIAAQKVVKAIYGDVFDEVMGQQEGIRRKPAPDGPLKIAEQFGVKPEECMYIGDTKTDMQTGKSAGMYTVGALWGFRDRRELEENGADIVAAVPLELVAIYEKKNNK